ncbi:MAG TPA: DUF177 domain-containing protein [Methylovirgula sp.]|jgi:uncharacterized metal-binding protein YceD (DUF177 family)|nr:DUF177 domain-containing protein [Methylovirgula sp.]
MNEKSSGAQSAIFSYPIIVDNIPIDGLDVRIAADEATRQALAKADGLPGIASLEAIFHLSPKMGQRINVSGEMRATVTQVCVVTLEPFDSDIVEAIDLDFAPPEMIPDEAAVPSSEEALLIPDPPDPIIDGKIDLGALASEFLALGLDPYPRKPGVNFEAPAGQEAGTENPFSVLNKLKERS